MYLNLVNFKFFGTLFIQKIKKKSVSKQTARIVTYKSIDFQQKIARAFIYRDLFTKMSRTRSEQRFCLRFAFRGLQIQWICAKNNGHFASKETKSTLPFTTRQKLKLQFCTSLIVSDFVYFCLPSKRYRSICLSVVLTASLPLLLCPFSYNHRSVRLSRLSLFYLFFCA